MLAEALKTAVSSHKLDGYDPAIIDTLQSIAIDVASKIGSDIEASAEPKESRSTNTIIQCAVAIALEAGRRYILWEDVELAIEQNFCSVWPFCKPEE